MFARLIRLAGRTILARDWHALHARATVEFAALAADCQAFPPLLVQCLLISAEDHRHGRHPGYDWIAICRALWRRLTVGSREGASTIDQQLVRVLTGRFERTLSRKIREMVLATLLAHHFPKERLPALYVRLGYYGWRMNGYRQACRRLGVHPQAAAPAQAAALVARLKYPEPRYAPRGRIQQIRIRTAHLMRLYEIHRMEGAYDHVLGSGRPIFAAGSIALAGGHLPRT